MPKTDYSDHPLLGRHIGAIDSAIADECKTQDDTNPKDRLASAKPDLTLVPPVANIFEAGVMGLGAKKYGAYNWRIKKVRMTVYLAAIARHLAAVLDGDDCDEESLLPHIAHIRANTGILLDAQSGGNLIDDRPPNGVSSRTLKEWPK